jgi:hypothetical protein
MSRSFAAVALLLATTAALSGCGSGTGNTPSSAPAHHTPAQSNADAGSAQIQGVEDSAVSPPATGTVGADSGAAVQRARATPATTSDDRSEAAAPVQNPCTLVSRPEAQALTGGAIVGRTEAPLGPTCIYKLRGGQTPMITLAVESLGLRDVVHKLARVRRVTVDGRRGFCGRLGTQMLFVELAGGQVLNVTAPCPLAQRFAASALGHIAS